MGDYIVAKPDNQPSGWWAIYVTPAAYVAHMYPDGLQLVAMVFTEIAAISTAFGMMLITAREGKDDDAFKRALEDFDTFMALLR